jgi:hypothetical protein
MPQFQRFSRALLPLADSRTGTKTGSSYSYGAVILSKIFLNSKAMEVWQILARTNIRKATFPPAVPLLGTTKTSANSRQNEPRIHPKLSLKSIRFPSVTLVTFLASSASQLAS